CKTCLEITDHDIVDVGQSISAHKPSIAKNWSYFKLIYNFNESDILFGTGSARTMSYQNQKLN
ncbi:11974_t:CDS:2, partial [Dentiscutata heterogama]